MNNYHHYSNHGNTKTLRKETIKLSVSVSPWLRVPQGSRKILVQNDLCIGVPQVTGGDEMRLRQGALILFEI